MTWRKKFQFTSHFRSCDFSQFSRKAYSNVINNWQKQITVLERGTLCDYFDV